MAMNRQSSLLVGVLSLIVCSSLSGCPENTATPVGDASPDTTGESCSADTYRKCTTSHPGVCAEGEQSCSLLGTWGPCEPKIQPGSQAERCTNSADDDCDGFTDDADMDCVACTSGQARDCTAIAFGICTDGQQICSDDQTWGVCGPKVRPGSVQEDCGNGLDDDCDNATDAADDDCEACTPNAQRACTTGLPGICVDGTQTCGQNELWGACIADVQPQDRAEDCEATGDEDCDGFANDADTDCQPCQPGDPPQSCFTGLYGICNAGTQSCTANNTWGTCTPNVQPGTQQENCVLPGDEDCDGAADNADTECQECQPETSKPCTTGLPGICADGEQRCKADGSWDLNCTILINLNDQPENCTVAGDEDCDGAADGADTDCCTSGATQECDAGNAYCMGTQTCTNSVWGNCTLVAEAETAAGNDCDGADDDCNGMADNGTFVKGPTLLVEHLPASAVNRMIGHNGEAFFFGRTGSGAGRWALWGTLNNQAAMLAAGTQPETLLNTLTSSGNFFTANDVNTASAMMVGPSNFPNSNCSGADGCLILVVGNRLKMVNLATRATSTVYLSNLPWAQGATVPTSLRGATSFPAGAFVALDGTPSADPLVLFVNGTRCWFWGTGGEFNETTAVNCFCHPSGTGQNCPSTTALNNLDAVTHYADDAGNHYVGLAAGVYHYLSVMNQGTAEWAVTYAWNDVPIFGTYPCEHTPR